MYFFYYLPVGINAPLRRFPVMTTAYAVICVLVFVIARYFPASVPFDVFNLMYVPDSGGVLNSISAAFLHFGYVHLIGNLIYLTFFGRYVEDRMGPGVFTLLYLTSAAVGNFAQGLFNIQALDQSTLAIVGASGAVSGMLGAFTVRFIRNKIDIAYWVFFPLQAYTRAGRVQMPAILAIAFWFVMQMARGLMQLEGAGMQVAYITHISGFLWGAVVAVVFGQHRQGSVESMRQKGDDYTKKGQPYAAQGMYIRYLTHRPDEAQVYGSLARAMVFSGNHQGAMKNYRKSCELLIDQGLRGACEDLYVEALRGYMGFTLESDHQLNLAFGLERNLKPKVAVQAYENFERRYPTHVEAPFALLRAAGLYRNALDEPAKARDCYEQLVDRYRDDHWVDFAREQLRQLDCDPVSP